LDNRASQRGRRVFLGSFILLIVSYAVYFIRYPIWSSKTIEPIFVVLTLSYLTVLIVALVLVKKDLKKPLSAFFTFHGWRMVVMGLSLAVLFQGLWYGLTAIMGARFQLLPFPTLRGYETYSYYSLGYGFGLYVLFSVVGAFAEEVAYRGYVQTRISAKYGVAIGISAAALFFAFEHIHIFQLPWIESFFQGQFISVLLFGIFAGYFFYKTNGDIWGIFAFHALTNLFNISLPIQITYTFPYTFYVSTITSYAVLLLTLRFLPLPIVGSLCLCLEPTPTQALRATRRTESPSWGDTCWLRPSSLLSMRCLSPSRFQRKHRQVRLPE
jgi:membrane protease YdiL (CAAX protease family)